ncbi:MAG: hypothetical protein ACC651_16540 [Candidatus Scalindua sp.]
MSEQIERDLSSRDLNNNLFWEEMQTLFEQTSGMISEMAEGRGIDLDSTDMYFTSGEIERQIDEAEDHYLSQAAREYSRKVNEWFEIESPLFNQGDEEINTKPESGAGGKVQHFGDADLREAVEVIRWYKYLISAKIVRALSGDDLDDDEELGDALQKDADGSVKVALIGMDRSIGAWGRLKEYFPDKTDRILDILLHLDRLRRKTEKEFPYARAFIRPGFDTLN